MDPQLIITLAGFLATVGITWGVSKATLANHQTKLTKMEISLEETQKQVSANRENAQVLISQVRENYVTHERLNETMVALREYMRDTREDVKKVLGMLTDRARS